MTFEEYQEEMKRTAGDMSNLKECLSLGAMGISGEAGEVTDYIKKVVYHSHEMSKENLVKELGDVLWYITYLAETVGYKLEDIAEINKNKLRKRYPDGWDEERSINR
ncbi:nucleoside triphosphate pyrophosphohydrolase family protein [Clostridium sediminicola]|uniref:nucleoside triphosphate pyrophosphohydrolase family protein n=1 Tax=Clostridium sediminicola TaxID=3114879 RepID=UPI0031F25700